MENFLVNLWLIATEAESIRLADQRIKEMVDKMSELDDVFCSGDMYFEGATVIQAVCDGKDVYRITEAGEREEYLAPNKRYTAKNSRFDDNDNETVLDSIDYFVDQKQGWCEDSYSGAVFFILNEDEKSGRLTLLRVGFET